VEKGGGVMVEEKGKDIPVKRKEKETEAREITPWRPLSAIAREMSRAEREMERMFEDFLGRPWPGLSWPRRLRLWEDLATRGPAIEVYEEKDDVVVKAELPGMRKEDLEVNISDNFLTIKGEKKKEEEVEEKGYYYSERSYGSFTRTVEIPKDIQPDKVRASFKDGVLEVRLPKTEEAKRKEVKIKVE
jgi:HSP20 family protein